MKTAKRLAFSLITSALILGGIEGALRLAGWGLLEVSGAAAMIVQRLGRHSAAVAAAAAVAHYSVARLTDDGGGPLAYV